MMRKRTGRRAPGRPRRDPGGRRAASGEHRRAEGGVELLDDEGVIAPLRLPPNRLDANR